MNNDILWLFVRLIVTLALVLVLVYVVLKYGLARRPLFRPGGRRMKILEQLPLGPKAFLSLVNVGGKYFLIAHMDNGVQVVKEYETLPDLLMEEANQQSGLPDFQKILRNTMNKINVDAGSFRKKIHWNKRGRSKNQGDRKND